MCLGGSEEVVDIDIALDADNAVVDIQENFDAEGEGSAGGSEVVDVDDTISCEDDQCNIDTTRHQLFPILSRLGLIPSFCLSEKNDKSLNLQKY